MSKASGGVPVIGGHSGAGGVSSGATWRLSDPTLLDLPGTNVKAANTPFLNQHRSSLAKFQEANRTSRKHLPALKPGTHGSGGARDPQAPELESLPPKPKPNQWACARDPALHLLSHGSWSLRGCRLANPALAGAPASDQKGSQSVSCICPHLDAESNSDPPPEANLCSG